MEVWLVALVGAKSLCFCFMSHGNCFPLPTFTEKKSFTPMWQKSVSANFVFVLDHKVEMLKCDWLVCLSDVGRLVAKL